LSNLPYMTHPKKKAGRFTRPALDEPNGSTEHRGLSPFKSDRDSSRRQQSATDSSNRRTDFPDLRDSTSNIDRRRRGGHGRTGEQGTSGNRHQLATVRTDFLQNHSFTSR